MTQNPQQAQTCDHGITCVREEPGHFMSFMRRRLARASRQGWVDTVVTGFDGETVLLLDVFTDERYTVWHHEDLRVELSVFDPVRLSTMFHTLALGDRLFSVVMAWEGR